MVAEKLVSTLVIFVILRVKNHKKVLNLTRNDNGGIEGESNDDGKGRSKGGEDGGGPEEFSSGCGQDQEGAWDLK